MKSAPARATLRDVSLPVLIELLHGRRFAVLTGAGCSTESGIPDYRGPGTLRRARNPVQYREFTSDPQARRRYWARATLGWPLMKSARPNAAHRALFALEDAGLLTGLVTQNVDRLHHAAGSRQVVELHGALAEVRCLECGALESRDSVQERLIEHNPRWLEHAAEVAPDGDAELPRELTETFRPVDCERCGGRLKPNVVFFGENVTRPVVERAYALVDEAEALLVVGSSLTVFSGFRFVKRAAAAKKPIAIVNLGATRGDPLSSVCVAAKAGELLPPLARALVAAPALESGPSA